MLAMKIKISIIQPTLAKNAIFWPRRPPCNGFNLALLIFADDRKSSIKYQRVLVFVSAYDQKSSKSCQCLSLLMTENPLKNIKGCQCLFLLTTGNTLKISGTKFFRYRF